MKKRKRDQRLRFFGVCQITIILTKKFRKCTGELEGAKPSSNQIECLAKPCCARRATGEAGTFAVRSTSESNGIFYGFPSPFS